MKSVIFCLLFLISLSYAQSWVNSTWTDEKYGGTLSFCFVGQEVHGFYSERGLIQGSLSATNIIQGNFYEAGGSKVNCTSGTVRLTIVNGGEYFTGSYVCDDSGATHQWNGQFIDFTTANADTCGIVASAGSVDGGWQTAGYNGLWYICTNDATRTFTSSYNYIYTTFTTAGAESGLIFAGGRILSGVYAEEGSPYGTDLSFLAYDGTLKSYFGPSDIHYNRDTSIPTTIQHSVLEATATQAECNTNLPLITFGTWGNSSFTETGIGGLIRVCIVENHVHGVFSEVGLVQGQLYGNKINGTFYQAGGPFIPCSTGNFEFTIDVDGNGFSGYFECSGSNFKVFRTGDYVGGPSTVNADTCAVIGQYEPATTAGSWTKGIRNWDVCINNGTYYSSYDYLAEPFHGYETGGSYLDGRIIAGVFAQQTDPVNGVAISWYTYEQRIDTYYWATGTDYQINPVDLNNAARHANTSFFRVGPSYAPDCIRNELVFDAGVWTNSSWINPETGADYTFCFLGNNVYGTFSNGYGIFEGILLTNSSLSVNFYQPGAGVIGCSSGLFSANIRSNGEIFEATLQCFGVSTLHTFTATKVGGNTTVNADTCAITASGNVTGLWVSDAHNLYTWSICTDIGFFESSYDIGSTFDGYYTGQTFKRGKILSGFYKENGTDYGVALSYRRYDGILVTNFWPTDSNYYVDPINGTNEFARVDEFSYFTSTTVTNCERNDYLIGELSVWSTSSWKEQRYGQTLYICIVDDKVYGAYSQVGILQGTFEGNRISGNFYQGGGDLVSCSTGTFQLSISPSGSSFSGVYVCSDNTGTFEWKGTFLGGSATVTPDTCAQTSNNGILAGSWNVGDFHWDVCFDSAAPGDYYSSFQLELSGIRGYNQGRSYVNNIIISGTYVDQYTPYGITLAWRKYNKQMGYFSWVTPSNYSLNIDDYENVNRHISGSLVNTGPASTTECIKNEYIFQNGGSLWQNSSWTDQMSKLAGSVYLCFLPNNQVHGSFSEIGLLQGFVNGRTVSGNFYKAGGPNVYCTSGTFQFVLSDDGSTFSGTKRCVEGDSYSWNEFLLSGPSLTIDQKCQVIDRSSSNQLRGSWTLINSTSITFDWDICYEGNSQYTSSYTRNTLEGYEYGAQWAGGDVLSGISTNTIIPYAISISWISYDGRLGNFFWATDELYNVYASSILDRDEHYVSYLTLTPNVTTTNEDCTRNVALVASYGVWTNSSWTFGEFNSQGAPAAKLFICIVNGKVHGSYGEFGILQGSISADGHEIKGNFYEAGLDSGDCTVGKFSLLIDQSGGFFTGYYTCSDNEEQIPWSETFLGGPESTNNGLCAVLDEVGTLAGQWSGPEDLLWSICIDNNKFESSFTTNLANSLGYSKGDEHRDGRVLNGIIASQRYPHGVTLTYRAWDGTLVEYFWTTNANYTITPADYTDLFRHYKVVCTSVGLATDAECSQYSYLLNDGGNDYLTSADLSTDNLSSVLLPALCIILLSILLTL